MEEDQPSQDPNSPTRGTERNEPVRSRWTPKPEQILILESIFNSGMVNPPKDETVRIRKILEKFGSVGDANVFYWFQNRRSRSRRRQRQIQAGLAVDQQQGHASNSSVGGGDGAIQYHPHDESGSLSLSTGFVPSPSLVPTQSSCLVGSSSSGILVENNGGGDDLFNFPGQLGFPEIQQNSSMASILCPSETSNLQYESGFITVFINGVPTEVPRAPIDMKSTFGQDVILVHSSGMPVPFNEYGFSVQSLQHGESYFLVSRPT